MTLRLAFLSLKRRGRVPESSMQMKTIRLLALAFLVQAVQPGAEWRARAQAEKAPYPVMAPLPEYLIAEQASEIALARSFLRIPFEGQTL